MAHNWPNAVRVQPTNKTAKQQITTKKTQHLIMKKLTTIFASIILMTLSANVMAQNTATESANASATLITAIDITKYADLEFGKIAKNAATAGTVTITPTDELGISYSPASMSTTLADRSAAKFTITGEEGQNFAINLPSTITLNGGEGNSMVINTAMNLSAINNILSDGSVDLYVGGTLNIGTNQAITEYYGSFSVTVTYE